MVKTVTAGYRMAELVGMGLPENAEMVKAEPVFEYQAAQAELRRLHFPYVLKIPRAEPGEYLLEREWDPHDDSWINDNCSIPWPLLQFFLNLSYAHMYCHDATRVGPATDQDCAGEPNTGEIWHDGTLALAVHYPRRLARTAFRPHYAAAAELIGGSLRDYERGKEPPPVDLGALMPAK